MPECTCTTCRCTFTYLGEVPADRWPENGRGELSCLYCRRAEVIEGTEDKHERVRRLAEFEILRTPTAPPSEIAKRRLKPRLNRTLVQVVRGNWSRRGPSLGSRRGAGRAPGRITTGGSEG